MKKFRNYEAGPVAPGRCTSSATRNNTALMRQQEPGRGVLI